MPKIIRKRSDKIGSPPGTLMHIGEQKAEKVRITVIDYNEGQAQEKEAKTVEECFPFKDTPTVSWINIDGLHEPGIIEKIGTYFNVHPLVLEDILTTGQRPKYEDFDEYIYLVLKMLYHDGTGDEIISEQVSLLLGSNYVISFQEREGDVFNHVRDRIKTGKGRIRKMGADFLAYSLIDAIVDNYFVILEKTGDQVDLIEEELINNPGTQTIQTIHELKKGTLFLRKSVWPLREMISNMQRGESDLIQDTTRIYLRDISDHAIQVIDTVETLRDMISGILDIYLSSLSNRMNEVMKTLTIFAAIFIPLTFIAGVYGMNFEYMPELKMRWGYPSLLLVMFTLGVSMLLYFRKKKWL
ncbi:magnesium/cobalt transporter CorA [bacterium]|nr:magnesium/cobalt transporter CorA [bacterium]